MNNVMKTIIVLAMGLLFSSTPIGCKEKSNEGGVDLQLQIGETVKYWTYGLNSSMQTEKCTQFSVTFDRAFVFKTIPWDRSQREWEGKKYLIVYAHIENMGPREDSPISDAEVKTDNGFIYTADCLLFAKINSPALNLSDFESLPALGFGSLKQGEKAWWAFSSQIPEEATPVELFGEFGRFSLVPDHRPTKFRLRLPKKLTDTGKIAESKEPSQAEEKLWAKQAIKEPSKGTLRDRIAGNYILEGEDAEEWQGGFVFNEDATITRVLYGNWQVEDGQVKFYIPGIDVFSGTISGDVLTTNGNLARRAYQNVDVFLVPRYYTKKETAKMLVKTEKGTLWSDYYVSPDVVKLKKDGTFLMSDVQPETWKVENEFVQVYASDGHKLRTNGRLEGEDIVFEEVLDEKSLLVTRFIKQDGSVSPKKGEAKTGVIKPSKRNIPGKYVLQWEDSGEKGKDPGVFVFKDDGTATYILAGNWQIENGVLGLYEGSDRLGGETAARDISIKTPYGMTDYIKKQGANPLAKSERITAWSEYVSPDNLKLKEDGIFFINNRVRLRWEVENGSIQIYELWDNNLFGNGRLQGDDIVFERYDARFRKVDGDLSIKLESMARERKPAQRPQDYSKEEMVNALEGLKNAIIKKIQLEVDVTVQCFTSVKEYKRAKLLADVLRPALRVIQGTLSVITKVSDVKTLSGQVKTSLGNAQYVSEAAALVFMINGLRESGEKLYYAIDDTAGYATTVKDMLQKADETTLVRMDADSYKSVIKQYLDSVEGTPLLIARTSELSPDKKPARGALALQRIIREEFRTVIEQIQQTDLPQNFPLDDAVAQIKQLRQQILESGAHNVDVRYSIYHRGGKTDQSRSLGAIAEHNKALASIARAVADRLKLEIHAEYAQLAGTGADIAYIVTYNIPGAREAAKVTQQATLLPGIVIEGEKMFTVDPEEEFYQIPQEMIFSLAIEFSNLLRISDDTVFSLIQVLQKQQGSDSDLLLRRHYVIDNANVITSSDEKSLNSILQELEEKTGAQYVVLTAETTGGVPIERFSLELANKWKLGQKGKDNGILFVIAVKDRHYRFELGLGLEHLAPLCSDVGNKVLAPLLSKGSYSEGIYQANLRIANKIADENRTTLSKIPN